MQAQGLYRYMLPEAPASDASEATLPEIQLASSSPSKPNDVASTSAVLAPVVPAAAPAKKTPASKKAKAVKVTEVFDPEAPIMDDCNEVRRKIRAHIASGVKVTHFLKDLGNINSNSYRRFMSYKLQDQGEDNCLYSAAYYFFEEQRIKEGKPMGKKRKENEAAGFVKITSSCKKVWGRW